MALSIVDFFEREDRTVAKLVDETFWRLMEGSSDIDRQMPAKAYASAKMLLMKMKRGRPTIASIVAPEQEIPTTRMRMDLSEEYINKLKVGKQVVWTENYYELLHDLEKYSQQAGNSEIITAIKNNFFMTGVDMIPQLYEKVSVLAMSLITTGACDFTDPLSGFRYTLSYADKIVPALMPAALTTTARWTQPATANGLQNLYDHAKVYYDNFGMWPTEITMRWQTIRDLGNQVSTKQAALSKRGATGVLPADTDALWLEDEEIIALIKTRAKVSTVTIMDSMYSEEQADGSIVDRYFLPDNCYYFSFNGIIERATVPTVEKNFQAGVYVKTKELDDAPKRERTVAVAAFCPFAPDPRKLAARKVA